MDQVILNMLEKYQLESPEQYDHALKEVIQEMALLGLWRAKFFERAAFYGGTALRILHGLNRFSEDLDFCLHTVIKNFSLKAYQDSLKNELQAFGFDVEIEEKTKTKETAVKSAFLRANTKEHLIRVGASQRIQREFQAGELIKIKMEVDTDPAPGAKIMSFDLLDPIPFWINTLTLPSLFAGKMHAVLCRRWGRRVKGRDWYDFLWFIQRGTAIDLQYLDSKMRQTGHYTSEKPLSLEQLRELIAAKVEALDLESAKDDVLPFLRDRRSLDGWTKNMFLLASKRIQSS